MRALQFRHLLRLPRPARAAAWLLAALLPLSAAAQEAGTRDIVQQRLPDGRVVITDQPQPGGSTLRRWQFDAEDETSADEARR